MKNGAFRKKKVYFTQVSNHALRDNTISLKAKGLYALIQSYLTLEDFTLYKTTLRKQGCEGEKSFENTWKELKDAGYLIQYKYKNSKGAFCYEYELLDEKIQTPQKEGVDNLGGGEGGCISNTDINNTDINNNQLVSHVEKPDEQTDEQTNEINQIITNARVDSYESEEMKDTIKEIIKDCYIDEVSQKRIRKLKIENIDRAIANYRIAQEEKEIKNPRLYFKKCLLSAIEESGLKGLF